MLQLDIPQLKSAGLSTRKAEYGELFILSEGTHHLTPAAVLSLAEHFASNKLSATFLETAPISDVSKALIDIRGIGQWTVDMFLMFTLRRPDVLPVGDLGVQKGLMKWVLAPHGVAPQTRGKEENPFLEPGDVSSVVPTVEPKSPEAALPTDNIAFAGEPEEQRVKEEEVVKKSLLSFPADGDPDVACPLPDGFSVDVLKSRMSGKKLK